MFTIYWAFTMLQALLFLFFTPSHKEMQIILLNFSQQRRILTKDVWIYAHLESSEADL